MKKIVRKICVGIVTLLPLMWNMTYVMASVEPLHMQEERFREKSEIGNLDFIVRDNDIIIRGDFFELEDFELEGNKAVVNEINSKTDKIFDAPVSDSKYGEFELDWEISDNLLYDMLLGVQNDNVSVRYSYNEDLKRIQKTVDGDETWFDYNSMGMLVREYSNSRDIYYYYDEMMRAAGFTYGGKAYTFKYDGNIITDILCGSENLAHYEYENGMRVYEYVNGNKIINKDEEFVGNANGIRYTGRYFDKETGWFFNGRYLDLQAKRYVDGLSKECIKGYIEEYGYTCEIISKLNTYYDDVQYGNTAAAYASGGTGTNIYNFSADEQMYWIARTLYQESAAVASDQVAVAHVIKNRMKNPSKYCAVSGEAIDIVTAPEQFMAFTNVYVDHRNEIPVDESSYLWFIAQYNAAALYHKSEFLWGVGEEKYFKKIDAFRSLHRCTGNSVTYKNDCFYFGTQKVQLLYIVENDFKYTRSLSGYITKYSILEDIVAQNGESYKYNLFATTK